MEKYKYHILVILFHLIQKQLHSTPRILLGKLNYVFFMLSSIVKKHHKTNIFLPKYQSKKYLIYREHFPIQIKVSVGKSA